jgi:Flp pilus assembly protein TadD
MVARSPAQLWFAEHQRVVNLFLRIVETRDEIFDDANGHLAIGELESAIEKYRRCVDIDPNFFDGWHALGMALMKVGRFNEAIEAGKKAVELKPDDQIGWTSLSLFYNRAGNIKEAEAAGTKAKILSWGGKIAQ